MSRGPLILNGGQDYATTVLLVSGDDFIECICDCERLEFNEMAARPELGRKPLEDWRVNKIRQRIEQLVAIPKNTEELKPFRPTVDDLWAAIDQVAHERPYHPVREYLSALSWDGCSRIDMFAEKVLGIEKPSSLTTEMLRRWFIGAVARAMKPGCKMDTCLLLKGSQGIKKTTLFEKLAGRDDWFLSFDGDFSSRDGLQMLATAWIVEFGELESMRGREITTFKTFSSKTKDTWVGKWQRAPTIVPRSYVIAGTTNEDTFLEDSTGNRRFWVIETGPKVRIDLVDGWRDELWAEAVQLYKDGERWWLSEQDDIELRKVQVDFERHDAWEPRIYAWLDAIEHKINDSAITVSGALEDAIEKQPGQWSKGDEMRVAAILKKAGYRRKIAGNGRARVWEKEPVPESQSTLSLVTPSGTSV